MATADDYASLIDPTGEAISTLLATPHSLPQGERGRLPWCNALRLLHPTAPPQGEGMVTADDDALLLDPT